MRNSGEESNVQQHHKGGQLSVNVREALQTLSNPALTEAGRENVSALRICGVLQGEENRFLWT